MMKKLFLFALLFTVFQAGAQDISGIWRGSFFSGYGFYQDQYKYEVQLNQLSNKSLQGVTYSYKTTVFYGKATLSGIYFNQSKSVQFKEIKLVDLKISDLSEPCLMECTLDYSKEGNTEYLKGTFTSVNANTKKDCGSGTVVLERVTESDFEKEDFIKNKKPDPAYRIDTKKEEPVKVKEVPSRAKENIKKLQTALGVTADGIAGPQTIAALKNKVPDFSGRLDADDDAQVNELLNSIKKPSVAKKILPPPVPQKPQISNGDSTVKVSPPRHEPTVKDKTLPKKSLPVPDVLKTRENNLVNTIKITSPEIKIQLYDNGEIDGDTITVYHNNEIVANKKGLSRTPITINITADNNNTHHEFVMVAENLGSIPPNTALMVIYADGKRYELFLSSDNNKNAKVVIDFQPK